MICPYCGTENPDNSIFCQNCNKWILAEVYSKEEITVPESVTEEVESPKIAKTSRRKVAIAIIAALCVVILVAIWLIPGTKPPLNTDPTTSAPTLMATTTSAPPATEPVVTLPYIQADGYIQFASDNDSLSILVTDRILQTEYAFDDMLSRQISLDRKSAVFQLDGLHHIHSGQIRRLTNNVIRFHMSAMGNGVAFIDQSNILWLYRADTQQSYQISDSVAGNKCFVISPDGKSVAYIEQTDETQYLHCWTEENDVTLGQMSNQTAYPISVSNGGTCVYYQDGSTFCAYNNKGQKIGLAVLGLGFGRFADYYLNSEHNQILYSTEYGYFLSENGESWVKLSSESMDLVLPTGCLSFLDTYDFINCQTYGIQNLRQALYEHQSIDSDKILSQTIYAIQDDKLVEVQDQVKNCIYLPGDPIVFLKQKVGQLVRWNRDTGETKVIVSNGDYYRVSRESNQVYYISDGILFRCNIDGSNTEAITNVSDIQLSNIHNGYIFWLSSEQLYACAPDGTIRLLLSGVTKLDDYSSIHLYAFTNTDVYMAQQDGTLRRLES